LSSTFSIENTNTDRMAQMTQLNLQQVEDSMLPSAFKKHSSTDKVC